MAYCKIFFANIIYSMYKCIVSFFKLYGLDY